MKKFITLFCVFCLFLTTVSFATAESYTGSAAFVVSRDNHLVGIKNTLETYIHFPLNVSTQITGMRDGQVIREKGLARFYAISDAIVGLSSLNVSVTLDHRYYALTKAVIGEEELNVENIIAATYYVNGNYIGHFFFDNATDTIKVGTIYFKNYKANLYLGDYNNDGVLELGFHAAQPVYVITTSEDYYVTKLR